METITLFGKTYNVSKQTKISIYVSTITILFSLYKFHDFKHKHLLINLILISLLQPYINFCVINGNCTTFSWIYTIQQILTTIIIVSLYSNKKYVKILNKVYNKR